MNLLLDAALAYAARGIPVYPIHWPRSTPDGTSLACSCPVGQRVTGQPSIPWSATAFTTPPVTRASSSAGGSGGRRPTSAWPPASCSTPGHRRIRRPGRPPSPGTDGGRVAPRPAGGHGGGGWHAWFRPTGLGNRPPHGLDHVNWRGRGGAVLAPSSRHASGGHYRWLVALDQAPLPEVPVALRALLDPDRPATTRPTRTAGPDMAGHPHGRTVLATELATSAAPPPATATTPSTAAPSRSTATSPAASWMTPT
jgi:Bifunctional DNA primase/polymerase, N-terminal